MASEFKPDGWQQAYAEALRETNPSKLREKISACEMTIVQRMEELSGGAGAEAEQESIKRAAQGLRILKRDKLRWPDWESM